MKQRRGILNILGIALLATLLLIRSASGGEKSLVIKLATLAPEGSSWMKTFSALSADVMKKTEKKQNEEDPALI